MWWIIGLILAIGLLLLFFRFTLVKEATAKAIVRMGGFKKMVISLKDYGFNEKWEIEKKQELHFGGLRFVGIWPLDKVYTYSFRWRGIEFTGKEENVEFHERTLDYILVRPDVYWTEIKAAETGPADAPERIPIDLQFLVTMRVINPKKTLFEAPTNWLENVLIRLNAFFRGWVATVSLDYILTIKKDKEKLWQEIGKDPLITMFEEKWGVKIEDNGIQIRDVTLPVIYREAVAKKSQMEFEAKGKVAETVGAVVEMFCEMTGAPKTDIQQQLKNSSVDFIKQNQGIWDNCWDVIHRRMGIDGKAYLDIRTANPLLDLIALWQKMPKGSGGSSSGEGKEKETTMDDLDKAFG